MDSTIQFINTTPEQLTAKIIESVSEHFKGLQQSNEDPDRLLTREETAELLTISLTTLNNWTKDKKLKAYGIKNRVYYKKSEVLSALTHINE